MEHIGFYTCKAKNEMGQAVTRAKFDIASASSVVAEPIVKIEKAEKTEKVEKAEKVGKAKTKKRAVKIVGAESKQTEKVQDVSKTEISVEKISESEKTVTSQVTEVQYASTTVDKSSISTTRTETTEYGEIEITQGIDMEKKEIVEEQIRIEDINVTEIKYAREVNEFLDLIDASTFGPGEEPMRDLASIAYLLQHGVSITEITALYNDNAFPALKSPESQSALVQLVEREGHAKIISEVITEESVVDETQLAATVGFHAFMRMVEQQHITIEEVLSHFSREDFVTQEWKSIEAKEVRYQT